MTPALLVEAATSEELRPIFALTLVIFIFLIGLGYWLDDRLNEIKKLLEKE